ncbi:MAG: hypothetical protein ABIN97_06985 [Ginsengibacter sp.]
MNDDKFEEIDKYLNGEMTHEQQLLFEEEMAKNEELSSAVNIFRSIEIEMSQNERYSSEENSVKKTLEELNQQYFKKESGEELSDAKKPGDNIFKSKETNAIEQTKADSSDSRFKLRKINLVARLAVAASIIGIIALSVTWYLEKANNSGIAGTITDSTKKANDKDTFSLNKSPSVNDITQKDKENIERDKAEVNQDILYAKYFKQDALPADIEGPLENAFIEYDNKKYAKAITAFDNPDITIITRGEESDQALTGFYAPYYKALCYMAIKNFQKAIHELDSAIANSPGNLFKIKAQWYLSLAYIKNGNLKSAATLLKQITSNKESSTYKIKAQRLIDDLNN